MSENKNDLFDAYIKKINAMNKSDDFSDMLSRDALEDADRVIAEAEKRREALRKKQEEEEAIALTDLEVAELSRKRKAGMPDSADAAAYSEHNAVSSIQTSGNTADSREDEPDAFDADSPGAENSVDEHPGETTASPESSRRKKLSEQSSARPPRRSPLRVLLLLLVLAAAAAGSVYLIRRYTPTSRRMSYTDYFGSMAADEAAIVLQDRNLDTRAVVSDGRLYLPYDLVREELNERFFWDDARTSMLFTTAVQTFEIPINSASYSVIDGALSEDPTSEDTYSDIIVLRNADGSLFVSLDYLCRYTDITYSWEKETQHVYLRNVWGDTRTANAAKDAAVRFEASIKSPILTDLNKGDAVMVLEELGRWTRVLTADGFIGYARANRLSTPALVTILNEGFDAPEYPSLASEDTISVVWHMISTRDGNKTIDDATASMTGVDVISPTWFSLADNGGNVESIGTKAYVKKAHGKDLKVWGLISDFSADMDTSLVLASTTARRNCIGQLVSYAQTLGLDGINLDFEYVEEGDGRNFSQFVRELSIACRLSSLVLSVDLVPPYDFNAYLNRPEIAAVADYLINMGYDEHYSGSAAGSVASLPYEENAIQNLLNMGIPAHKIISGIPFYTRIWYTSADESGQTYVSSEELSMNGVSATLESWNVTPVWDADAAQNYAKWTTGDGVLCQIWIEDADSLARKALLIPKYELGGTAIWVLGFENSGVWQTISDALNLSQEAAVQREQVLTAEHAAGEETETEKRT